MLTCPSCGHENPDGARFCNRCAAALGGEAPQRRRLATLLFCDVSGSTATGERLDSESVRDLMFRYFHEMRSAIERHGGTVEKFIGDAVVAVFGVPLAHEDDALRAVRAAAEMQELLAALNEELEQRFGTRISLRIGLDTGEVVAGDASSRETFVTGDTVNVAARLEQAAKPGDVLLGEQTYRLVRDAVEVDPLEPLELKGKAERVPAYRLVSVIRGAPPLAPRLEVALVGRRLELDVLGRTLVQAVTARGCRLVTVVGEPGVGKSRLAHEFLANAGQQATVLSGRALSYGEGITFWPIREVVRQAATIRDEDTGNRALRKLAALVEGEEQAELIVERMGQILGLATGAASVEDIAWAIRRLLEALARRRPLVIVLDDVHWAEPALLDILARLPTLASGPIVLLCLARPELLEARPEWEATLRLEPLQEADAARLVDDVLGGVAARPVSERILASAGGNPLFIEQLVAMLVDDGLLERRNGRWAAAADLSALRVPDSVKSLLTARLDRLEAGARATLERGAVEGQLFHRGAVLELSDPDDRKRVGGDLMTLIEKQFLQLAPATFVGEAAFRFRHILIGDAAYDGLAKKLRADLHERFAAWLERKAGERLTEYAEILGYHLEQAYLYRTELGPPDERAGELALRAGTLLAAAGQRAAMAGDSMATVKLLSRARTLLPPGHPSRPGVLSDLADALPLVGELERARAVVAEALEAARDAGDVGAEWRARVIDAWLPPSTGSPAKGPQELRSVAERAIQRFEELGDERGLARAWHQLSVALEFEPRLEPVREAAERALEHAWRSRDGRTLALSILFIGAALCEGPTAVNEAVRRCRELVGLGEGRAGPHWALARLEAMRGNFAQAREEAARARSFIEQAGLKRPLVICALDEAEVEMRAGDPVAAEGALRPAFQLAEQMEDPQHIVLTAFALAEALLAQRRDDEAETLARMGRASASGLSAHFWAEVTWRRVSARVSARRGELEAAEGLASEALDMASSSDQLNLRADAAIDFADVVRAAGRTAEAARLAEEGLRL
ncbi:MAG: AAA family ATPase, partial [Actinobacteria bacterium]|nr:AAA family ATPase [Actinomycetota bacterium]